MTQDAKAKRKYSSPRRQAQGRETRRQIVEAAQRMFSQYGYTGATIEAIAQEAGVAPETVYATFGSKRAILKSLIDVAVGGDDQPIPLLERPGPQAVFQESDPARFLRLFAADISQILERVAPIFVIMRMAAKTEPDIAGLLKKLLEERLRNMAIVAQRLSAISPLRAGSDVAQAAETLWTITSPEVFSLLTVDRGWPREQYAGWLGDTLVRLLLA